jgi:uncharacterized protein YndB with AHSA1/START domain
MTDIRHTTFVIERIYPASPMRVFAAWSDPKSKARWASCHGAHKLDFRVGGRENDRGEAPDGHVYEFQGLIYDIVPNERIIYAYDLHRDGVRISVSLVTVTFEPAPKGTRLVWTEQGVFIGGIQTPDEREEGTKWGLTRLDDELKNHPSA